MQTLSSRWLVGIAAAISVLILISVVIALANRPGEAELLPESEPEGVVQRYILAVQDQDSNLAHSYLSDDLKKTCSVDHIRSSSHWFKDTSREQRVAIIDKETLSDEEARVRVRVTEVDVSPPFGVNEYSHQEHYFLVLEDGKWRLGEPAWPVNWCPGLERERFPKPILE